METTTVNVRIGRGKRVHKIDSKPSRHHVITACGRDNSPIIRSADYASGGWFHRDYRSFAQTTEPVDCRECLTH